MTLPVTLVQGAYIAAGLSFILALAGLSKHESARAGNRFGIIGMAIALVATILAATGGVSVANVGALTVGIEINANHVRGVREGWVHGTARPLHLGRTTQLWEIRIVDDAARLVCISRLTIGVMPREARG